MLHTVIEQKSACRDWRADCSVVDQLDACLQATAKKGIGRAANMQIFGTRGLQDGLPICAVGRQRFFTVERFVCCQHCQRDFRVDRGYSQVDYNFDLLVG